MNFCMIKKVLLVITITISYTDYASGIWLRDCFKLTINSKMDNDVRISRHKVIVKISWRCFVSFVKFSDLYKFHVNIISGSGVMAIFFYKGLTWNPENGITPVWVLTNIWRLGGVRDTRLGTNVSDKKILNAAKCQGYNFYRFWDIKVGLSRLRECLPNWSFRQPCLKKYHHLFVWCLKLKINKS